MSAMATISWPMARIGFTRGYASDLGSAEDASTGERSGRSDGSYRGHLGVDQRLTGHARPGRQPGELEQGRRDIREHAVVDLDTTRGTTDEHERDRVERVGGDRVSVRVALVLGVAVIGGDRE